jgi:hypothetical protein
MGFSGMEPHVEELENALKVIVKGQLFSAWQKYSWMPIPFMGIHF